MQEWRFAANAVWEEALSLDAGSSLDIAAVEKWVLSNPQNIAFEAIFAINGTPSTMLGIRLTPLAKAEQVRGIKALLSKTESIQTEGDFKKSVADVFPDLSLFNGKVESLNIGVTRQWYSFGEEVLWKPGRKAPLTFDELKEKAPRFFEKTLNPAALEFWYTKPLEHWYKIYVSDPDAQGYKLNPIKYRSILQRFNG
jgi:hypothetical protein